MSDVPTNRFSDALPFEERVIAEFGRIHEEFGRVHDEFGRIHAELAVIRADISALDNRLTLLEDKVDARLRETRPIWEAVQEQVRKLDQKFDLVIKDLYEVRTDIRSHDKRLSELENRPS